MSRATRSLLALAVTLGLLSAALALQVPPADVLPAVAGGPRYWKGNLHTHSLWSDGDDFPEMIADWYKEHGYQFLALTDHNVLAEGVKWVDAGPRAAALAKYRARFGDAWVERRALKEKPQVRLKPLAEYRSALEAPGRFLLLPAEEITHKYAKAPVHLNGINLRDVIAPVSGDGVAETVRVNLRAVDEQRRKTGWRTLAFVNHPNFGWGVRAEDLVAVEELQFFEIYNGHPGVRNYGDAVHAGVERVWDVVLAHRLGKRRLPPVYGLATDDAHEYHALKVGKANPGRGWVMVRAPFLTAEAVVEALHAGDFYSTTGVTLTDVRREGDTYSLAIAAAPGVTYRTQFIATMRDAPLDSEPQRDEDGRPLDVTRVYSPEVGKVVAEVDGPAPSYRFTGRELYVRAKVVSSRAHPNPFQKGDAEVAWTQPVVP